MGLRYVRTKSVQFSQPLCNHKLTVQSRLGINEEGGLCLGPRQYPTLVGRIYQNLACMISCDSCTGSTIDSAVCSECSHLFSWDRERKMSSSSSCSSPKAGKYFCHPGIQPFHGILCHTFASAPHCNCIFGHTKWVLFGQRKLYS